MLNPFRVHLNEILLPRLALVHLGWTRLAWATLFDAFGVKEMWPKLRSNAPG